MKIQSYFRKNASFFVFVFCLLAMRWSFADQYQVPTGSMEPTIHVGDRIFVNKAAFALKLPFTNIRLIDFKDEPKRGSIVVFESVENPSLTLVKRLIGLPGDEIEIQNGFITVNGQAIEGTEQGRSAVSLAANTEVYYKEKIGSHLVSVKREPLRTRQEHFNFTVPKDHYFMMGDNRDNSYDSRYSGFVPRENLKGEALRVLWNLSFSNFKPKMELNRIGAEL